MAPSNRNQELKGLSYEIFHFSYHHSRHSKYIHHLVYPISGDGSGARNY